MESRIILHNFLNHFDVRRFTQKLHCAVTYLRKSFAVDDARRTYYHGNPCVFALLINT